MVMFDECFIFDELAMIVDDWVGALAIRTDR